MTDTPPGAGEMTRRQVFASAGLASGAVLIARAGAAVPATSSSENARFTPLYPHESATRTTRDLSGLWDFRLDPDDQGEARRWFDGFDRARRIPVPCSWNDLFDDAENYFGAVWYQTEFRAEMLSRDRRLILRFGSAVYHAKVWLNGQLLGEHSGGHLPFAFDATDAVRGDTPNRLVVMVENRLQIDRVPAIPDTNAFRLYQEDLPETSYDFFPYSGLHRPVWLYLVPVNHVSDLTVVTRRQGSSGLVDVRLSVANSWSGPARLTLTGGPAPIDVPLSVIDGTGAATISVPSARLWNPADPLYAGGPVGRRRADRRICAVDRHPHDRGEGCGAAAQRRAGRASGFR
jgi:beta-glucuronidase